MLAANTFPLKEAKISSFIVIKKYSESCFFWGNLLKKNRLPEFPVEDLIAKYQGFEGELIGFFPLDTDINEVYQCLGSSESNLLLVVRRIDEPSLPNFNGFQAIGYDYGVCDVDKTIYSSIFNEILFGSVEELVSYKGLLNECFLFQDRELADAYVLDHHKLLSEDQDVEHDEEMSIYEVWSHETNMNR